MAQSRAGLYAIAEHRTPDGAEKGVSPAITHTARRNPVTGFVIRCWLTLSYMRQFNYSSRLAWLKARR